MGAYFENIGRLTASKRHPCYSFPYPFWEEEGLGAAIVWAGRSAFSPTGVSQPGQSRRTSSREPFGWLCGAPWMRSLRRCVKWLGLDRPFVMICISNFFHRYQVT